MRDLTLKQRTAMRPYAALIEENEKRYAAGDKAALLETLFLCANFGVPIPMPTRRAFCHAVIAVRNFEHKSWDAVFGKPHPAGLGLHAHKKEFELGWKVYWRVLQLRSNKPKPKEIFRTVGKEFRISGANAKRYFDAKIHWQKNWEKETPYLLASLIEEASELNRRRFRKL